MTEAPLDRLAGEIRQELLGLCRPSRIVTAAAYAPHLPGPQAREMEGALFAALKLTASLLSPAANERETREARAIEALRHLLDIAKLVRVARAQGAAPVPFWVE